MELKAKLVAGACMGSWSLHGKLEFGADRPPNMGKDFNWNSLGRNDLVQHEKLHAEEVL